MAKSRHPERARGGEWVPPDEPRPGYFQIANPARCAHWSPPDAAPGGRPRRRARATCLACVEVGLSKEDATGVIDSVFP